MYSKSNDNSGATERGMHQWLPVLPVTLQSREWTYLRLASLACLSGLPFLDFPSMYSDLPAPPSSSPPAVRHVHVSPFDWHSLGCSRDLRFESSLSRSVKLVVIFFFFFFGKGWASFSSGLMVLTFFCMYVYLKLPKSFSCLYILESSHRKSYSAE